MAVKTLPPILLTWRILLRCTRISYLLLWLVIAAAAVLSLLLQSVPAQSSYWEQVLQVLHVYSFVIGVRITYTHLTVLMNHGLTRKQMAAGTLLFGLGLALANGILMGIGFAAEHSIYVLKDWHEQLNEPHLFTSTLNFPAILIEYLMLSLLSFLGGHFIATSFYRFGKIAGYGSIALFLLLNFGIEYRSMTTLMITIQTDKLSRADFTAAQFFIANGIGIALLIVLVQYMLRTADIKPKTR